MKTCIISIAKHENLYVEEWVNHHLNLGFDRIFICDNNKSGEEKISDVIDNEKVTILDYHDVDGVQRKAYTQEFINHHDEYDWLAFLDLDEFIMLDGKYNGNIKSFLGDKIFDECDIIRLCWKIYTTNTELDVKDNDYRVVERFKDIHISGEENFSKSIIRGSIEIEEDICISGHGLYVYPPRKVFSSDGNIVQCNYVMINREPAKPIYDNAWLNHYPTKTMGEFIRQKYFRGGANHNGRRYSRLDYFFKYNDVTEEKERYGNELIEKYKQEREERKKESNLLSDKLFIKE